MCFRPDLVPNMNRFSVATSYVLVEGVKKRKKKKKKFLLQCSVFMPQHTCVP